MKALIFVDLHDDLASFQELRSKAENVDIILGAGDYSMFGNGLDRILYLLNSLKKPCYLIHGNHEYEEEMILASKNLENINLVHGKKEDFKSINITGWGGDGFSREDKLFEVIMKELIDENTILLLHGPPSNTTVDEAYENTHVGNESYRRIIQQKQPLLVVCGHIHQTAGRTDKIKNTIIINPGPSGEVLELKNV